MILTVVGSGTLVPHPRRSTAAIALSEGDTQITVDGGSGTLRRQAELGLDFRRTRALVFTHIHPDHTLDLLQFLFASKYTPGFRRDAAIRIIGPPGFAAFVGQLRKGYLPWTDGGEAGLEITELADRETVRIGSIDVEAVLLEHGVTNHGYRFRGTNGRVAAFTGDTEECPPLADLARDASVLVSECSGTESQRIPGHLTAREAGRAARLANVGQLVLSHLYPLDPDTRLEEAREAFSGPVLLAEDGTRFIV